MEKKPNMTRDEINKVIDLTKNTIEDMAKEPGFKLTEEQQKKIKSQLDKYDPRGLLNKVGNKFGVKDLDKVINKTDLDSGLKNIESIINKIRRANPSVSQKEAEEIVSEVKSTISEVKAVEPDAIKTNEKEVLEQLPEAIKAEGLATVKAAAGYLPFIDKSTLKLEERTGKGGRLLKPKYKVVKPKVITKHKTIFDKLPAYKAETVAKVAGRVFNGGAPKSSDSNEGCGRLRMAGNETKSSVLDRLRARMAAN